MEHTKDLCPCLVVGTGGIKKYRCKLQKGSWHSAPCVREDGHNCYLFNIHRKEKLKEIEKL